MTKIEWTHRPGTKGESWNFLAGCSKVSPGCDSCWALSMSWRIQNSPKRPERYEGITKRATLYSHDKPLKMYPPTWTGRINLDYDALEAPYRWKKPRTVFVCSMADLFHEKVPGHFILSVFEVMRNCPQHTFLVLTKRASRMEILSRCWDVLPNIWLGVTAENQEQADLRIPLLLQTPAVVRWVSCEPLLGPIDLEQAAGYDIVDVSEMGLEEYRKAREAQRERMRLDWIAIGCENGPNRRPMRFKWAWDLLDQCDDAGVYPFVKQITLPDLSVSKNPDEWPRELRRREWPR